MPYRVYRMEIEFQKQGGESKLLLACTWIKATGKAVTVFCLEYILETKQAFLTRWLWNKSKE